MCNSGSSLPARRAGSVETILPIHERASLSRTTASRGQRGNVVAIEPFATGGGKATEGAHEEIYSLEREASVRNRQAREALEQIVEEFKTLPFARRWLDTSRAKMALRRLEQQNVVHGYPVLKEQDGYLVSQREHTVIVTEDGCEVTTR